MKVNGKNVPVGPGAPVGYALTPGKTTRAARRPASPPAHEPAWPRPVPPVRAGILVTGTEVLTGIITDRNGPWLSERLVEHGVDAAMIQIVGDRPGRPDGLARSSWPHPGMALIVTSGGLGPTADDLTAEIVGALRRARDGAGR